MAKNEKLENKDMGELISILNGIDVLINYYDNIMRSNQGYYSTNNKFNGSEINGKIVSLNNKKIKVLNLIEKQINEL